VKKRQAIIDSAVRLFGSIGFDATTTLEIENEAGVTEPLIYYHFKGKDDLFTGIIDAVFSELFSRINALEKNMTSPFGQIRKLIELQYDIAEEMSDEVRLIAHACPARLNDPEDICARNVKEYRRRLLGYLTRSLSEGIESGEFAPVPLEQTAILILSMIDSIVRYSKIDRDLAELYSVETRVLNQAVTRNADRFPNDFMFPLSRDEIERISQIVTSSKIKFSKSVRAFLEQGVAMLSSVLRSKRAIQVNIPIMRAS
jgi:AcrR family transcriptional regulator